MHAHDPANHAHDLHGHDTHGHGGLGKYIAVFVALCALTTASFFTYSSYWPWQAQPAVGRIFMMAVSTTKAMLVILFFMHLLWEKSWKYVLTIPAAIMCVFLFLALVPDIGLRGRHSSEERKAFMAEPRATDAETAHGAVESVEAPAH